MNLLRISLMAASLVAISSPAHADARADMEKFMADYLELWNAHDAAAITERVYRLDGNHPWSTREGMQAEFDRLKAQGYDKSGIKGITGCVLGPDTGQVELRYIRLKSDGSFMPPKDRASIYQLRKFPDGWRVTSFAGLAADARMECPAH